MEIFIIAIALAGLLLITIKYRRRKKQPISEITDSTLPLINYYLNKIYDVVREIKQDDEEASEVFLTALENFELIDGITPGFLNDELASINDFTITLEANKSFPEMWDVTMRRDNLRVKSTGNITIEQGIRHCKKQLRPFLPVQN